MSAPYQLLPPLTEQEYADLKADIDANGIEQAIIVDDLGQIIDGHHRALIADELGIDCPCETRVMDSEEAKRDLALRLNVHRRSLTRDQKRELLATLIKAAPEKSDRQHAAAAGVHHNTATSVRSDLEATGEIRQSDERLGADGRMIRPAKISHRTTETETVDYTSPGSGAPVRESAPPVEPATEPGAHGLSDVIAQAHEDNKRDPGLLAQKAIERLSLVMKTIDAAGGLDEIEQALADDPIQDDSLWLPLLTRATDAFNQWSSNIRRRNLRSVK